MVDKFDANLVYFIQFLTVLLHRDGFVRILEAVMECWLLKMLFCSETIVHNIVELSIVEKSIFHHISSQKRISPVPQKRRRRRFETARLMMFGQLVQHPFIKFFKPYFAQKHGICAVLPLCG